MDTWTCGGSRPDARGDAPGGVEHVERDSSQVHIAMAWDAPAASHPDAVAARRPLPRVPPPVPAQPRMGNAPINEARGQRLGRAGLHLEEPVFAHDQLYAAASRAGGFHHFRVVVETTDVDGTRIATDDTLDGGRTRITISTATS